MFARTLTHDGHTREFTVRSTGLGGWEVREEQDRHIVRQACYSDWHRVERAMAIFSIEAATLEAGGWQPGES